ncbi:inositol-pentakisphosphate 2-kinase [Cajanus cajan]|uniref:Inositol-pentakisphosphate 2-kinase n=1 Tax=Cajanus cajan TaxID=3821 RepID=A0A151TC25_CAJCA|nr:inositol-pentakisphosphate 2-kinase [Cajanus cajan]XP_020218513.1 inositol-pentakisphosphate 2-kinase [Cajanus cajan]KYP64610.1 Inositol-pentakisphosphate 2-kinase [Cajanus cajan]
MEVILNEKNAGEWVYRGEGAANLVLAYTGSSPTFIGKVMRIRKAPRNGAEVTSMRSPSSLTAHERLLWKDVHELISSLDNEIAGQLFVLHVMKPLLGSKYVDAGMLVGVSMKFLESVEKNVICQRPAWRVDNAQVDMHRDSVLLMSDHSLFTHGNLGSSPSISVEIKPKCGFLPLSRFISEGTAIKKRITRFQMHQALKLHRGEIALLSEYNPLDLFSGSKERIHKAIKDLFTTPQNNFRVFKNGSLIFGGLGGGAEDTNFCIAKAFEDALKSVIRADDGHCTENLLTLVAEAVKKSGVLDRLLEVQKLDNVDIEGAIHAYYDITRQQCMICRELSEEQLKRYSSLHSASLDESLRIVKDYLIAATAKDCSFMICFRPRKEGGSRSECSSIYLESTKQAFDFKVYFIDLDLKRMSKMEEYYELDKKIVSCYKEMIKMDQGRNSQTCKHLKLPAEI